MSMRKPPIAGRRATPVAAGQVLLNRAKDGSPLAGRFTGHRKKGTSQTGGGGLVVELIFLWGILAEFVQKNLQGGQKMGTAQ